MGMEKTTGNEVKAFAGGRYARTEEELHDKAVSLLDKCKVMTGSSERVEPEAAARTSLSAE